MARLVLMLLAAALILAACGGNDDGDSTPVLVAPSAAGTTATPAGPGAPDAASVPPVTLRADYTRLGCGTANRLAWSPDGSWLAIGGSLGLWRYDLPAAADPAPPYPVEAWPGDVVFSPDGALAFVRGDGGALVAQAVATGERVFTLEGDGEQAARPIFSPDGARLASLVIDTAALTDTKSGRITVGGGAISGGYDIVPAGSLVRVWDLRGDPGAILGEYEVQDRRVLDLRFTSDGALLMAGSDDNLPYYPDTTTTFNNAPQYTSRDFDLRIWNLVAGELIATLHDPENPPVSARFSPDGAVMVLVFSRVSIYGLGISETNPVLWPVGGGADSVIRLRPTGGTDATAAYAFSPAGDALAIAYTDYSLGARGSSYVMVWDIPGGVPAAGWAGDQPSRGGVYSLVFSRDGTHLAGLTDTGLIQIWQMPTGAPVPVPDMFMAQIADLAFTPDSRALVSAGEDGAIRVWDVETGDVQYTLDSGDGVQAGTLWVGPDNHVMAMAWSARNLRRWDFVTGLALPPLETGWNPLLAHAFSPDGRLMATARRGGTVSLWSLDDGRVSEALLAQHQVSALAWTESWLITGGFGGEIQAWDLANPDTPAFSLTGHTGVVTDLIVLDGGATLLSASRIALARSEDEQGNPADEVSPDRTFRLWDLATGQPVRVWTPDDTIPLDGALSPDGRLVAAPGAPDDPAIHVWDVQTGVLAAALDGLHADSFVTGLAWSPDGTRLAAGSGGLIHLWRLVRE